MTTNAEQPEPQFVASQIQQLDQARDLVLKDPNFWPQVLTGILPVVQTHMVELRRWGADFMAETFSSPVVDAAAKRDLALLCLDTLLLLTAETEAGILKDVVQCSASIYPLIYRYTCSNRDDPAPWNKMMTLKAKVLALWDEGPIGVRICCIKFVQRVVLVQSRGQTDPRLIDRSEISLNSVPSNHPTLSLPALDAEAQGLLDRLLGILHEENSEPTLVTATLNNLGIIVKTRPPLAAKVLGAAMSFNPFTAMSKGPITVSSRLVMLSLEKTVRNLLLYHIRSSQQSPFGGRIQQHLGQLQQARLRMNEEFSKKRSAKAAEENAKRLKMDKSAVRFQASTPTPTPTPPPPPTQQGTPTQLAITGPMSYAQLFTLATDPAMTSFDGQQLPLELVLQIVVGSLYSVQQSKLDAAVHAIKTRYEALLAANPPKAPNDATSPDSTQPSSKSQKLDNQESRDVQLKLGEFRLPPPQRLSAQQMHVASIDALDRMFAIIDTFEKTSLISRKSKLGVQRLAASNWDREGWVTLLIRMATRGFFPLTAAKIEDADEELDLANAVREKMFAYITGDFRGRMDVAVAWLNEEWYNDQVPTAGATKRAPQYQRWLMRTMDVIFPFLEAKDRVIMRMLSEIPEIPGALLEKMKMVCLDPDRAMLGIQMLHYLTMLRPPVRNGCLDILEDLYRNHIDLRAQTQKLLTRWRPSALAISDAPAAVVNGNVGSG